MKPITALAAVTLAGTITGGILLLGDVTDPTGENIPVHRKVVLHGLDCEQEDYVICDATLPLLREAEAIVLEEGEERPVTVEARRTDGTALTGAAADMLRFYFLARGFDTSPVHNANGSTQIEIASTDAG